MTSPFAEQIEQAMAALREHQDRMAALTEELAQATTSATSKDRMVTAKVGPQGQVLALTFHTSAWRTMAAAELSAVLVDVLNEARAEMGGRITESMRAVTGLGDALRHSMTGGTELDELLAPLRAVHPGSAEAQGRRNVRRQEHFNG
ncbi:YbaB/EbfC family nucleoid-associated protein [Streptomyces sp. WAC06614]|uniref:YbaB/EbfC family nucleoid-associated protein n=1 Tax=Streptomyces sp. WAC06614 TaxID=2487416 RepID=UPI000F778BAD|nr:YbaB/EbfC family nucleoid-associated protein [Streptomyces sp. WAC06614]RSS83744.1 YbaB/EbfC family DNA-binding protein [Streptomyces sp. WAC06614]